MERQISSGFTRSNAVIFRRKARTQRRPELPRVPAIVFYPRHTRQTIGKYARYGRYALKLYRMRARIEKERTAPSYRDLATTPVIDAETETLEMFELNPAARAAVDKARRQVQDRVVRQQAAAQGNERQSAGARQRHSHENVSRGAEQRRCHAPQYPLHVAPHSERSGERPIDNAASNLEFR